MKNYKYIVYLAVLFCTSLIVSNIIAGKLYAAPWGIVLTTGVWIFPIVYIIGDVVPEVYGLAVARKIIILGFFANLFAVAFFWLCISLPYPPYFMNQDAFVTVLGFTPRLLLASAVGYLVGTNLNAWVMVKMKALTRGKWLWSRTISSTIVGESVDSLLFIYIAFWGVFPMEALPGMVLAQAGFKTLYEVIITPFTYIIVNWFKRAERMTH